MTINSFIELAATLTEAYVIIASVTTISGRKHTGKMYFALVFLFSLLQTIFVSYINRISAFSFFTPIAAILFITLLASAILSNGRLLLRATACITTVFVIQIVDYILFIGMGLFYGNPDQTFSVLMTSGMPRSAYLIIDKSADVLLFISLRKMLPQLSHLPTRLLFLLFGAGLVSYITMQYLFGAVIYGDYNALHTASIVSFFFLLCFLMSIVFLLLSVTSTSKERMTNNLLQLNNLMMEQNYKQMHSDMQENSKRFHDYHHHLKAVRSIAIQHQNNQISSYIDSLLDTNHHEMEMCHSGNDIIDAVINCKAAEAISRQIKFYYSAWLPESGQIEPVDLCAIIANQIENAFEACEKISDVNKRIVKAEIRQREGFAFFTVINNVNEDPFQQNKNLITTKTDTNLHGLGIKNIQDISKKYNGSLQNEYRDGQFYSSVLLCFTPI